MTDAKRKMHLAIQAAAPGHPAGWRVPGGERQAGDDVAHYQNVARICECALLDVLFLADSPSFTDDGRSPTRSLDPIVLITACALATEHLGLVLTASTTFSQPYNLARSLVTLDQVSRGRVGWNIVTTADAVAGLNFGMTEMPASDLRYEMAADFTAAVRALWDSWDDGALVGDVDTGLWADINRIHAVNYAGRHYATAGPMQVWRSPQGQPVLVQAGSSPQGRDFAARVAEIVFSIQTRFEDAVAGENEPQVLGRESACGNEDDGIERARRRSAVIRKGRRVGQKQHVEQSAFTNSGHVLIMGDVITCLPLAAGHTPSRGMAAAWIARCILRLASVMAVSCWHC